MPKYFVVWNRRGEAGEVEKRESPFYGHRGDAFLFAVHHGGEVWVDYGMGKVQVL